MRITSFRKRHLQVTSKSSATIQNVLKRCWKRWLQIRKEYKSYRVLVTDVCYHLETIRAAVSATRDFRFRCYFFLEAQASEIKALLDDLIQIFSASCLFKIKKLETTILPCKFHFIQFVCNRNLCNKNLPILVQINKQLDSTIKKLVWPSID